MIERLSVKGFRALRDFSLEFPVKVPVVLIGANGTGKTSLLEVFELLGDIAANGIARALARRGGYDSITTRGGDGRMCFALEYKLPDAARGRYVLALAPRRQGWQIEAEELDLWHDGRWCEIARNNADRRVYRKAVDAEPLGHGLDNGELLLTNYGVRADVGLTRELLRPLHALRYVPPFDARAGWARRPNDPHTRTSTAFVEHATQLDVHGLNLLNVLHTLSSDPDTQPQWRRINSDFRREFPYVGELSFPASQEGRGRVVARWRDQRSGQQMFFDEMSDGMIVYLTLLTTLQSGDGSSCLALDEPDLHLHPSLLARVVENMEDCAERRTLVVATHSERLLDFLSDPILSIHVVDQDHEGGTRATRLDEASLRAWMQDYKVSQLRHMGLLDRQHPT